MFSIPTASTKQAHLVVDDPAPRIVRAKGADELGTGIFPQLLD